MSDPVTTAIAGAIKRRSGFPTLAAMFERNAEAVRSFGTLPDDAWTTLEIIGCLEHCTVQTIWRRSKLGTGPRIVIIGGQARISVGEYRALNQRRRAAAAAQPEPLAA
jgi:hypothetical protein